MHEVILPPQIDILTGQITLDSTDTSAEALQIKEMAPLLDRVATQLVEYSLDIQPGDKLLVLVSPDGWQMASRVMDRARLLGAEIRLRFTDSRNTYPVTRDLLDDQGDAQTPDQAAESKQFIQEQMVGDELAAMNWAEKVLVIRDNQFEPLTDQAQKVIGDYKAAQKAVTDLQLGEKRWCLIYTPNAREAAQDGLSLAEYQKLYYQACEQDWPAIEKAQEILIEELAKSKAVRVTAPAPQGKDKTAWTTDVTMSIEGMRGANSVPLRNMPGSEVFLAPVAGTLDGTYALPYPVLFEGKILPNIRLVFKAGRVVDFRIDNPFTPFNPEYIDEGKRLAALRAFVKEVLARDDGSNQVGELGIGTNPAVTRAHLNTLLVEKAGVSIHLALGDAYKETTYFGKPIKVDNGVRSSIHIDLTRMLNSQYGGGQLIFIQEDPENPDQTIEKVMIDHGRYLDPRLAAFNPQN